MSTTVREIRSSDMLQGQNDWRNISDIVRTTLKGFHDVLRRHSDALNTLTTVVDDKASRQDVSAALQSSTTEVCSRLQEVENELGKCPDRLVWTHSDCCLLCIMRGTFSLRLAARLPALAPDSGAYVC